jgi:serine/threonine protein kinase
LDFCPGGEFFFHLTKLGKFPEPVAKFYFAEIVLALKFLHENNILYRDLKVRNQLLTLFQPENILLDYDGHIKLTDFGLSKLNFGPSDLSYSFCGSPEYMSPEMLRKEQHGR